MWHMPITFPPTTAARAQDDERLATDLGRVMEEILERTAHGLVDALARHAVTPLELQLMRQVHETLGPDTLGELARRTGIEAGLVEHTAGELAARGLLVDRGAGFGLTPQGRGIVLEIARARREDLLAFVGGLPERRRLRFGAAVHLLSDQLDAA